MDTYQHTRLLDYNYIHIYPIAKKKHMTYTYIYIHLHKKAPREIYHRIGFKNGNFLKMDQGMEHAKLWGTASVLCMIGMYIAHLNVSER